MDFGLQGRTTAVVFLCSKQASFITGLTMRIDGGSVTTV
jgi:NAD(P)-dependent dehydrogenase (short-subunit alcohol dehydrogenase family)